MERCSYCKEAPIPDPTNRGRLTSMETINDTGGRSRSVCGGCRIEMMDKLFGYVEDAAESEEGHIGTE